MVPLEGTHMHAKTAHQRAQEPFVPQRINWPKSDYYFDLISTAILGQWISSPWDTEDQDDHIAAQKANRPLTTTPSDHIKREENSAPAANVGSTATTSNIVNTTTTNRDNTPTTVSPTTSLPRIVNIKGGVDVTPSKHLVPENNSFTCISTEPANKRIKEDKYSLESLSSGVASTRSSPSLPINFEQSSHRSYNAGDDLSALARQPSNNNSSPLHFRITPSMSSRMAFEANLLDIENYVNQDLQGLNRLSY
ncbi:hypothetical protein BG011_006061 [Mortierella polycephala]|uniref:Uncharacterized protein n=1 Tax=Mortierella polycephala TaxID=41804 RepID=A0A9P6U9C4_9FUNG|nr:hypothetical protein BG011_006061 [Mortierella polycephala]